MQNQWADYEDFDLAVLCHDYGLEDVCVFAKILPVKLANRTDVENILTRYEQELAFEE